MPTVVYFVAEEGPSGANAFVKIGVTSNLAARLAGLQAGNPRPLHCIGVAGPFARRDAAMSLEAELHRRFAASRVTGEWFRVTGAIMAYARQHLRKPAEPAPVILRKPGTIDGIIWCPDCGGEPYTVNCEGVYVTRCIACNREGPARLDYDLARAAWDACEDCTPGASRFRSGAFRSARPDPVAKARRLGVALAYDALHS